MKDDGSHQPDAMIALLHDLQVHQLELELQNEELRRAQRSLDASRARYFDLYDKAPVGYCTVSEAGVITEANLTLAGLVGVARSDLVERPLSRFVDPQDQDTLYHLRQQDVTTPLTCELRLLRTDGTAVWVGLTATVERDPADPPAPSAAARALRVVVTDISARKDADAARSLLEAELVQAQKLESLGRLAGGVAHDFNNMLCVILGNVELALDQVDESSPLHADLLAIGTAAQRSTELTGQLLAYARKQVITPRVIDLNATVADAIAMLKRLIGEDIQLVWNPAPNLWPVRMDPAQVTQILVNLCINARDAIVDVGTITIATYNGGGRDCRCGEGSRCAVDACVALVVSDDGAGMDAETRARAFEPFFTTKASGKGTGLGLAMVYGEVKQNSGFIDVRSAPGAGTTFTICLPRSADTSPEVHRPLMRPPAARGSGTILVVEDQPALLKVACRILTQFGYTVLAAGSPADGLRLATERGLGIDLILTDVIMPGMNGVDLVASLKPAFPSMKCLFMSGYTADRIGHHGVLKEGTPFLQKPFSAAELISAVRAALD